MAVINGTAAAETLTGTADADVINGLDGNDVINGLGGNDTIQGGLGADTMDGGTGADLLIGGAGDDVYILDQQGDQVIENANEGNDLVQTTVSYILAGAQSVETLQAIGSDAINLTGNELVQTLTGNTNNNLLDGGVNTTGGDILAGGIGSDTYLVRNATDVVLENAGQGSDTVFVASSAGASYTLATVSGVAQSVEYLSTADQSSTYAVDFTGNNVSQVIVGNQGVNALADGGGTSGDTLIGLGGNDTYTLTAVASGAALTSVVEAAGGGVDTVVTSGNFSAGTQEIENITAATGATAIRLVGSTIDQTLTGNDGANVLNGGGGNDSLVGGLGNDTYIVDGGDTIVEDGGAGSGALGSAGGALDTVISSAGLTLASGVGVEQIFATGSSRFLANGTLSYTPATGANQFAGYSVTNYGFDSVDATRDLNTENTSTASVPFLNGNEVAQLIVGNASDNVLDGNRNANGGTNTAGTFADTLAGLAGNDTYRVYAQEDVVLEDRNGGRDSIFTSASYSLVTNDVNANAVLGGVNTSGAVTTANAFYSVGQIEVLSTAVNSGTDAINLTGNAYGNIIVGNFGANVITGGGTSAGGGTDVLIGLAGNDTYVVDSINSVVFEDANGGSDTVTVSDGANGFTLNTGTSVEFMNTSSATGVAMVGNELAQSISGGAGADTLVGGGGNDTLAGGAGNDTYRITDNNTVIVEAGGTGTSALDSVFAVGISYRLAGGELTTSGTTAAGLGIEYLSTSVQAGTEAITLTGNNYSQVIIGNLGNNVLDSGQGAVTDNGIYNQDAALGRGDTLAGLGGNDTYRVYSQFDVVSEGANQGTDTISTSGNYSLASNNGNAANGGTAQSIEVLRVDSSVAATAAVNLTGDSQANTLIGHAGQNVLDGGAGNDTLTGGNGADRFQFTSALGAGNVDTITDFQAGDLIQVQVGAGNAFATTNSGTGTGLTAGGTISADNFVVGTAAADNNDYFIYNQTTGQLFFDADGNGAGAAVLFAQLTAGTALGFNDIVTI